MNPYDSPNATNQTDVRNRPAIPEPADRWENWLVGPMSEPEKGFLWIVVATVISLTLAGLFSPVIR